MGISKSTVYLYAQRKSALFDLAIRDADEVGTIALPEVLPVPVPAPGQTLHTIQERLQTQGRFLRLHAALAAPAEDTRGELSTIISDIYDTLHRNQNTFRLLNASARDQVDIASIWSDGARFSLLQLLSDYLRERHRAGQLATTRSVTIQARLVIETTRWFSVDRHWDMRPDRVPDDAVRDTVVQSLTQMFFEASF